MSPREICRRRLRSQQLAAPLTGKHLAKIVSALGAVQAQDYLGALWSIGVRHATATEKDVERALADRTIARTWLMRGTLHFVATADIRWLLALLTPRILAGAVQREKREFGLDAAVFARARKIFTRALRGGNQLTRDEMHALLERAGIATAKQRGYHILWRIAQEGLICFSARTGKQHGFALLEEWAPDARELSRDASLAELARRYFRSHGPATLHDFAGWSGLTIADARAGMESVSNELTSASLDGADYWFARAKPSRAKPSTGASADARVHLLPGFDEYLLGYKDRSAALDPAHARRIVPWSNGMFQSTIVVDGRIAGTWKRTLEQDFVLLEGRPFAPLSPPIRKALATAAKRYGQFLGVPVETKF